MRAHTQNSGHRWRRMAATGLVALLLVSAAAGLVVASHAQSEPNDTFADAVAISGGTFASTELGTASAITGNVNDAKDYDFDWFKFSVDASTDDFTLTVTNDISQDGDIAIELYDPNQNLVKTVQTETDDETVSHTVSDSNLYGDWRVKIYAADDPTNDFGQAGEDCDSGAVCDGTYSGTFSYPPTAAAAADDADNTVLEGEALTLNASGSTDPDDAGSLSYTWDLGDGNSTTGAKPTVTYATDQNGGSETYTATVTVSDGVASDTDTVDVTVVSDFDGDGTPDTSDTDDDDDGLADASDPDDYDADIDDDGLADGVEDGLGTDVQDADSDGDGIDDAVETDSGSSVDTDSDGTIDALDTDSDDDGIDDSIEGTTDTDSDGTADFRDTDSDGDGRLDTDEATTDSDSDGTADFRDTDSDDDGVDDGTEVSAGSSPVDADSDNDGIGDAVETNSGASVDTDSDGTVDAQDTDSDGDGVDDSTEGTTDTDGDGTADYRDTDSDDDGVSDAVEASLPTSRTDADSDGDGIGDAVETDSGSSVDTDSDGTIDALDTDSDGDTIVDSTEGTTDTDGDGVGNYRDTDADGDAILDADEPGAFLTPETEPPTARIAAVDAVNPGESIAFDATASGDNAEIETYTWDFDDDGLTDATGATPSRAFASAGTRTVTLTVTDYAGNVDTATVDVTVLAGAESFQYIDHADFGRFVSPHGTVREVGVRFSGPIGGSIGLSPVDPSSMRGPSGEPSLAVVDISVPDTIRDTPSTVTVAVGRANLAVAGLEATDLSIYHEDDGEWDELETRVLDDGGRAVVVLEADTPGFSRFAVDRRSALWTDAPDDTADEALAPMDSPVEADGGDGETASTADGAVPDTPDEATEGDDVLEDTGTSDAADAAVDAATGTRTPGFGVDTVLVALAAFALVVGRLHRGRH